MQQPADSLIARNAAQLPLLGQSEMDAALLSAEECGAATHREFTGARLFEKRPETYSAIVRLLAEGLGMIRIGRLLSVSPNTVRAVRDRERASVDIEKEGVARLCLHGAEMCVEGILEDLDDPKRRKKTSTKDKAIVAGILTEKHQLLSGGLTSRVGVVAQPSHDDFLRMMRRAIDGEVVVVDQQKIGCGGETPGQMAAGSVPATSGSGSQVERAAGNQERSPGEGDAGADQDVAEIGASPEAAKGKES